MLESETKRDSSKKQDMREEICLNDNQNAAATVHILTRSHLQGKIEDLWV